MFSKTTNIITTLILIIVLSNCALQRANEPLRSFQSYSEKDYNGETWMTENLKFVTDSNGYMVRYFIPNNDSANINDFGLLYDFETACKVCPKGWHLPTENEWNHLIDFIGKKSGNELKDSVFWKTPGQRFNNKSGFSIRPAGYGNSGEFDNFFGTHAIFWSATRVDTHFVKGFVLTLTSDSIRTAPQHPTYAFSVRCVKTKKIENR